MVAIPTEYSKLLWRCYILGVFELHLEPTNDMKDDKFMMILRLVGDIKVYSYNEGF